MRIVKNKKGYAVRFYDENGVQQYLGGFNDQKAAEKAAIEYRKSNANGVDTNITVEDYLKQWFEDYVNLNTSERTKKAYNEFIAIHAIPNLGKLMMKKIKPADVQQFYTKMRKTKTYKWKRDPSSTKLQKVYTNDTLSNSTVLKMHRILHKAFKSAVALGYCEKNVCDFVTAPGKNQTQIVIPTDAELKQIYDMTRDSQAFIMIYISSVTGMRLGEVAGLQNDDIDINKKLFYVKHSFQRVNRKMELGDTKTHGSKRQIPMLPGTVEVIKSYIKEKLENKLMFKSIWNDSKHFCVHKDGKPVLPANVSTIFKNTARKLKMNEEITFHSLRHYHATWLLRQGVHPKIVSERLGHSTVKITLDTYTRLIPNLQEDVINSLDCKLFEISDASKKQVNK